MPRILKFSAKESEAIDAEICMFLDQGVIEQAYLSDPQYVSNIFVRGKKDGSYRMILNLSDLNKNIPYQHFKMETVESVITLLRQNAYLASIDLTQAYYSIPIHVDYRPYLKFVWKGNMYRYKTLPNGLALAPRVFTRLLKPIFSHLREMGYTSSGYIDDSILIEDSPQACMRNIDTTINLFTALGFYINYKKSTLVPTQEIKHLGFILNTEKMTVTLPIEKKAKN